MTSEAAGPEGRRNRGTAVLIGFLLLSGLIGAGFLAWRSSLSGRFRDAAEVSIAEFRDLKTAGQVKEVWLEEADRYVDVAPAFVRYGLSFDLVHAVVPPAYLLMPQGMNQLRSGMDPSHFHVGPK